MAHNKLKLISAFAGVKLLDRRVPLHVSWVVTSRCNLRCAYCNRPDTDPGELTTGQATALIDDLARSGCAHVSITGGEPLLRKDLPILMARIAHHGMKINMNTNGLLLPERLNAVRLADSVVISLDGPPELNDAIRGKGAWDGAMRGAEQVRNIGLPLTFYTVIGKTNVGELRYLVELADRMRARVFFQPGARQALGSECGENLDAAAPEDYRQAMGELIEWKKRGRPIGNSVAALRYLSHWPDEMPMPSMGGRLYVRIDSDGHVRTSGRVPRGEMNSALGSGGIVAAMKQISAPQSDSTYSAARVEVNLMAQGSPGALWNFLRK
jgi:MoaA/NifB/PqqE/SkfB family radical SAM enzyme